MLTLTTKLTTQAGKEQEFEAKMRLVVPWARKEPGKLCLQHASFAR